MDRRSFLGSLLGIAATTLIAPKRSFFFFGRTWKPTFRLQDMHYLVGRNTYGENRPHLIALTKLQRDHLWSLYGLVDKNWCGDPINNLRFNGIRVVVPEEHPTEDICSYVRGMQLHSELRGLKRYDDRVPHGIVYGSKELPV